MFDLKTIQEALLNTPYAKQKGDEYIYVRCPLCGDSMKHLDGAHCSIWVKPGQPLIYHCWICEESGIVNRSFLDQLGIDEPNTISQVMQYNKASNRGMKISTRFEYKPKDWKILIPQIRNNSNSVYKLHYMQERLGINFTYKSMEALRIIFSLKDFLVCNGLEVNPIYKKSLYYLDRDYIGFISTTKDMVILRSVEKNPKMRYIKYPIFPNNPEAMQTYILPANVDVLSPEVNLYLAEGPFDILGVFFHVMKAYTKDSIYASIGGSAYSKTIEYFLHKGFITNLNVNVYSDKDKPPKFYENIIKRYEPWINNFRLFYNQKSKDCGVTKNLIEISEAII